MKFFIVFGVIVHLILLSAVFKIYFKSPLEHGMLPHRSLAERPAKRLVLFSADGLRAQALYNSQFGDRASFLYSKLKDSSVWGVAHTRVPTESRPGHVAILAGFNEDPSAITQGWQSNPVEYDSVINQSSNAWCWGSPDIVKLFGHDNAPHIHLSFYDAKIEDFSGKESSALLDMWVFDNVEKFMKQQDMSTCTKFCEDGNIIFLHLLGLDIAGHSFKPLSKEYADNIKIVDKGIQLVTQLIENFFNDMKTAYIFTSDHGMTNWGSHGDGSEHETNVPFIAWGAGIKPYWLRQDIAQSDIAPLISSLIGINIPLNSNGVVPLNFIDATLEQKAHIIFANTKQLLEQYLLKHRNMKKNTISFMFIPFPNLSEEEVFQKLHNISFLIKTAQYKESIAACDALIELCKNGLKYYHSYYQTILLAVVSLGYVGWILLLFISITNLQTDTYVKVWNKYKNVQLPHVFRYGPLVCGIMCVIVANLIFVQQLQYDFYIYFLFPIITWYALLHNYKKVILSYGLLCTYSIFQLLILTSLYFLGVEVLLYAFYEPNILLYLFVILAVQAFCYKKYNREITLVWVGKQISFGLTPYIIGIQSEFSKSCQIIAAVGWILFWKIIICDIRHSENRKVLHYQLSLLTMAFVNTILVDVSISQSSGLWLVNQCASWIIFAASFSLPLFTSLKLGPRLVSTVIAFVTPYTLMSTGCESIFMFFFAQHMINWVVMEHHVHLHCSPGNDIKRAAVGKAYTNEDTVRRCFYLLSFIMISFFGVGNIASLNSFNPTWVRCFVTVFSPFTMTALILVKLILPFLVVVMAFRSVVHVSFSQIHNCFFIILLFCNLMVLQFFFLVKDEGSWLEIGLSLSRFIVAIVTTIALLLLYGITGFFDNYYLPFPF